MGSPSGLSNRTSVDHPPSNHLIPILTVLAIALLPVSVSAQDLFAEVFGDTGPQEIPVPAVRSGVYLADVTVQVSREQVRIALEELIAAVEDIVDASTVTALRGRTEPPGPTFVPAGSLNDLGIVTVYRDDRVELAVSIAPDRLREQVLNDRTGGELENLREPSPFSGYLNLRATALLSTAEGPGVLQAEFEPVLNYQGWVGEASATVYTGAEPVVFNDARVVRDLREQQLRLEAGNPRYRSAGPFGPVDLIGVSVTRRDALTPEDPIAADGSTSFVVPERGPVEIYLNGRIFRTYTLSEGPHTVLDVPLGRGTNSVQVVRPARNGGERTVLADTLIPFAPGLLVPGRHDYSYAAGVVRREPTTPYVYGFHRYGLFDQLTLGGAAAATLDRFGLAATGLFASVAGVTDLSLAVSAPEDAGFAADLSHVVSILPVAFTPTVELILSGRNGDFRDVASGRALGAAVQAGTVYSQRLPAGVVASLGLVRQWDLEVPEGSETSVRLAVSYQSSAGFALSGQIGPRFSDGAVSWQGSLFVRISDPDGGITTTAGQDIVNGPARLSVSSVPQRSLGSLRWTASYQGVDLRPGQPQILDGAVTYEGYRMSTSIAPEVRQTAGSQAGEARITADFASAVAVADGTVAVSRPIEDSFVILRPRPLVAGFPIPVRGSGGGVSAVVDGGPVVVSNLPSYRGVSLQLDGINLPDGYSVGDERHGFRPGYRSGYLVEVGGGAAVYARGRLVDGDGAPIGLEAGEVIAGDGTTIVFFTNEEGEFEVTGLSGGEYRLTLFRYDAAETIFAIPPEAVGRYNLQDVVFLTQEEE